MECNHPSGKTKRIRSNVTFLRKFTLLWHVCLPYGNADTEGRLVQLYYVKVKYSIYLSLGINFVSSYKELPAGVHAFVP